MGTFHTGCRIENPVARFDDVNETVETVSQFAPNLGTPLKRGANERAQTMRATSNVAVGLLGARSLKGLNLGLDARCKKFIAFGPLLAAKVALKP